MKRDILLGTVLSLAASLPALADTPAAAQSETLQHEEAMTKCEKKAREHEVSAEEMQSYINKCVSKKMKKEKEHDHDHDHAHD